jgi:hypothetical protein
VAEVSVVKDFAIVVVHHLFMVYLKNLDSVVLMPCGHELDVLIGAGILRLSNGNANQKKEKLMDKVYCENCVHVGRTDGPSNELVYSCKAPIPNWLSPTAPCDVPCSMKNHDNNCKDFKAK